MMRKLPHLSVILLLAAALLLFWRVCLDTGSPYPLIIDDMAERPATADAVRTPPPDTTPYGEPPPAEADTTLFARHCAACHGADGSGRSYVAAQPGMPAVSDLSTNPAPAAQKRSSILDGRGAMPAFGKRLRADELEALHAYILSLPTQP